jgi:LPXTG-site transpeptidase (sortase) family protein
MMNLSSPAPRRGIAPARRGAVVMSALLVALAVGGCSATAAPSASQPGPDGYATSTPSAAESSTVPTAPAAEPKPQAATLTDARPAGVAPASLTVPTMELTEPLIPLGIQSDGTMEVPEDYGDVGWFTGGGLPGGVGPTVIAGHVDSRSGPAVFFRLGEMVVGDRFSVAGVDGTNFDYEVYKVEDHAKAEFPTVDVFGATMTDEVRLITCGGVYDDLIGRYTDNLVVFASRV